jgi:uncharacterized protein
MMDMMSMNRIDVERRLRSATGNIEMRAGDAAGGAPMLSGYAARFNSPAVIGGYFIEKLAPGCFANSIARGDQRMLYNHDANYLLGRTASGTLTLSEDALGLKFELAPPDTCCGRDVVESVRRADLNGCSFAFQSVQETWDDTGDMPVRTIEVLDLLETSIVVWPAYKDTSVGVPLARLAHLEKSPRQQLSPPWRG